MVNRTINILLIEDNPDDVSFIQKIMSEQKDPSFSVESVGTLSGAIARLDEGIPDVILLDLSLPDSTGLETFVKVYQRVPSLPILLLSGVDDDAIALEAVLKGAQDYLMKEHVHGKMLSRVLLYAIERKRSEEALRQIAQSVSSATGDAFFRSLVHQLTKALNMDVALIAEVSEEDKRKLKTIALYAYGKTQDNIELETAPSPFPEITDAKVRYCQENARSQFPLDPLFGEYEVESFMGIPLFGSKNQSLGLLMVMGKNKMEHATLTESMLQIFAARAGGELERRQAEKALARAREQEIAIGFRIQQDLLLGQPPDDVEGVRVAAHTTPSQEVDGDFYDFFRHGDDCFDVIIGDFMGKGIPAALLGAATKSHFLRAIGSLGGNLHEGKITQPEEIVQRVHQQMAKQLIALESFVTICYARFDLQKKEVCIVDCGHTETIHFSAKNGSFNRIRGENMPMGFSENETYKQFVIPFDQGDFFFFYSDGVTQAINAEGEMFGEERLGSLVSAHHQLPPQELISRVCDTVLKFSESSQYDDDITCVAVKITALKSANVGGACEMEIESDFNQLDKIREFVRSFCHRQDQNVFAQESMDKLEIAVHEAATNIIEHAYEGRPGHKIKVRMGVLDTGLSVDLYHCGRPFDRDNVPPPSFDGSRDGGFGVFIIENYADQVTYSSEKDVKRINLIFNFKSKQE